MKIVFNRLQANLREAKREEHWVDIVVFCDNQDSSDPDEFLIRVEQCMTELLLHRFKKLEDQKDIDDMLKVIDLVINRYLNQTDAELYQLSRNEKKTEIEGIRDTKYITEDLKKVEKVLKNVLKEDEMLDYREAVTRFTQRNSIPAE